MKDARKTIDILFEPGQISTISLAYGADALAGWKHVVDEVHAAGGAIVPQLWHVGQLV